LEDDLAAFADRKYQCLNIRFLSNLDVLAAVERDAKKRTAHFPKRFGVDVAVKAASGPMCV